MIGQRIAVGMVLVVLLAGCGRGEPVPEAESVPAPPDVTMGDTALRPVEAPAEVAVADPAPASQPAAAAPPARRPPASRQAAPSEPRPAEPPPPPPPPTVREGTELVTTSESEITTRRNKAGEQFTAKVATPIAGADGNELVPAGAVVTYTIVDIQEAENKNEPGVLVIRPVSLAFDGASYPIAADVTELAVERKGRGVTAGDAGKVAAGAAAGAILGRILTKKGTGAVVGGAVGAAAGTAIAVNSADKDLVIPAGARIVLRLVSDLVLKD